MANLRVEAQDEQTFLKAHYETLQKDREKDPRAAFAARPGATGAPNGTNEPASTSTFGASVVGPMASSSLNLPSVERALERDPDDVTARLAKMVRKVRWSLVSPMLSRLITLLSSLAGLVARRPDTHLTRLPFAQRRVARWNIARSFVESSFTVELVFWCTRRAERSSRQLLQLAAARSVS